MGIQLHVHTYSWVQHLIMRSWSSFIVDLHTLASCITFLESRTPRIPLESTASLWIILMVLKSVGIPSSNEFYPFGVTVRV